jgi:hypothetical protein
MYCVDANWSISSIVESASGQKTIKAMAAFAY